MAQTPSSSPNPYAPPRVERVAPPAPRASGALKWLYLGLAVALLVAGQLIALVVPLLTETLSSVSLPRAVMLWSALLGVLGWVKVGVGLVWLHGTWSSVPTAERLTPNGGHLTPAGAVGRLFIPFYGLYWMFAVNAALSGAIDRVLAGAGRPPQPRAWIAHAAMGGQLVQLAYVWTWYLGRPPSSLALALVSFALSSSVTGAWFAYMWQTDRARAEMEDAVARKLYA